MELFELPINSTTIATCDENGKIFWSDVSAITRHDPGEILYEIKTYNGRTVIVPESKSLLIWNCKTNKLEDIETPLIKVDDKVPIIMNQTNPPIIHTSLDMNKFFPKNEYIYGSEFYNAIDAMKNAMEGRAKIPEGWWQKNNGTLFTLPYPDKAKLQRASSGRCKLENIKKGYIYPYHATRQHSLLPEKFELNYDNGVFIGLFLADGNAHILSGKVTITKKDEKVKAFVKKWFDKYAISHYETTTTTERGSYTEIQGSSTLFAKFLHAFVGHGSKNKYVPDIAFSAPDEFINGLLTGYFSGDGTVDKNGSSVTVCSVSPRLIEGIAYLSSRFGIFGRITSLQQKSNNLGTIDIARLYTYSIRGQWAKLFSQKIELIIDEKRERLKNGKFNSVYKNTLNDVVLDNIIEINKIDVKNYPKLYDITVPSTLNFVLGNGLCIKDTSETGYIQRRLVKAMEDCKVYYDQTVRNATGAIVQYVYGEDGIDGIKIENQYLPYIGMNLIEMDIKYNLRPEEKLELFLTEDAMKQIASEPEWMNASREYYEQLLDDRQYLINDVFRGEKVDKIQYPIPFDRIIRNALQRLSQVAPTAVPTDLTPGYVLDALNKLLSKLRMLEKGQGVRFLHILLRLNLCPKVLIMEHHMSKTIFEWLVNEIELRFMKSLVHPGEMVGIIAAQSIGELSTQQTLDSFHSSGTAAAVKATSGVPRLKELLSVSKNIKTPSLLICLKPDIGQVSAPAEKEDGTVEDPRIQETKEKCIKVMQQLEITRMVDILDSTEIFWDPAGDRGLNTGITDDDGMLSVYRAFANIEENQCRSQSPWVLRMKINKDRLYRLGLTMIDIYIKLTTAYHQTIECVFSDDNATELIFRVRLTKEALKDVDPDDYISALKAMEHNIVTNILLKGLKGVKKVSMRSKNKQIYNAEKDKFEKVVEWMMDTDGTNLQDILANVNVDQIRTRSNDIYEIYQTLGIEAARNALYVEFMEVVGEGAINYRHMSLLLDTMTNRGTLMSVDRHGINRGDVGPLAKSSFEETTDMLINASMFSEHDRINGVSANIMLGQLPPCGTGDHEVLLDEDAFVELMKDKRKLSKKKEYMRFNEPVDDSTYAEKEACAIENIAFNYTLPERNKNIRAFPKQSVTFV